MSTTPTDGLESLGRRMERRMLVLIDWWGGNELSPNEIPHYFTGEGHVRRRRAFIRSTAVSAAQR